MDPLDRELEEIARQSSEQEEHLDELRKRQGMKAVARQGDWHCRWPESGGT